MRYTQAVVTVSGKDYQIVGTTTVKHIPKLIQNGYKIAKSTEGWKVLILEATKQQTACAVICL